MMGKEGNQEIQTVKANQKWIVGKGTIIKEEDEITRYSKLWWVRWNSTKLVIYLKLFVFRQNLKDHIETYYKGRETSKHTMIQANH
jgi:hypothetical protein